MGAAMTNGSPARESLNWFGQPHHSADDLVHWRDYKDPAHVEALRAAYDTLVASDPDELKLLLDQARLCGAAETRDDYD